MQIVLIEENIKREKIKELMNEFPEYLFLSVDRQDFSLIDTKDWERIEIFFGSDLPKKFFEKAKNLNWIHSPSPYLNKICLGSIKERGTVLLTKTKECYAEAISEYVLLAILFFAKRLDSLFFTSEPSPPFLTLSEKIHLQIGHDEPSKTVSEKLRSLGMETIGIAKRDSVRKGFYKTLPVEKALDLLPSADSLCLFLDDQKHPECEIILDQITKIKKEAIVVILDPLSKLSEKTLYTITQERKDLFLAIDTDRESSDPIMQFSSNERILMTHQRASNPKLHGEKTFREFRSNLSRYAKKQLTDLKNRVPL